MNLATVILAATATAHFVGIIAFQSESSSFISQRPVVQNLTGPEDHGERVAGLIVRTNPININQTAVLALIPHDFLQPIPAHTAMIMYRTTDFVATSGTSRATLPRDGLEYIPLNNGDLVTFETPGATNAPATIPSAALPHHPARSQTATLNLLPAYDTSGLTNASLVRIPVGTLTVCQDNGRYDTSVALNTTSSFVIKLVQHGVTKSLILKPGAEVSIVNVPLTYATNLIDDDLDENHYLEYCVMAGIAANKTSCPRPIYPTGVTACSTPGQDMLVTPGTTKGTMSHGSVQTCRDTMGDCGAMADCSNTQWP